MFPFFYKMKKTIFPYLLFIIIGSLVLFFSSCALDSLTSHPSRAVPSIYPENIPDETISEAMLDADLQAKVNAGSGSNFHNLTALSSIANEDELHFYNISSTNYYKITLANLASGISGSGEANTVSSAGSGTSLYYQKSGVDLQFNAIKSENNRLSISLDGITHDIELTVNETNIDHDNLANFLQSEHFTMANITTIGTVTSGDVSAIESDPGVITHESTYNHVNYNTAYGWGDHSTQNYLDLDTYPNADTDSTDDLTSLSAGSAGIDVAGNAISLDVAPSSGSATLEEAEDAVQVKYDGTYFSEGASGLTLSSVSGVTGANEDDVTLTDVQAALSNDFHNVGGTDDERTQEEIDDFVSELINDVDSVHTRITITYDDTDNAYDFVVDAESDPNALLTAETDNVKDTHIDWGTEAGQVSADDIGDGSTNAIVTLTQETNFETAYTHSQDNTQAHSDYVLNTGADTLGSGSGFALTFDAGATDPVFTFGSDSVAITNAATFTVGGSQVQVGTDDDVPESGDFGAAADLEADGSLSTGVVADNEIDYTAVTLDDFDYQTAWRIFYSNTDGDVTELALGSSGQYLKSQGTSSAPTWDTPSGSGSSRWTAEGGSLEDQDADTMRITTADDCDTHYPIGTPIRYSDDQATYYYGIVVACTDNGATLDIDLDGFPLSASNDAYFEYGSPEVLHGVQLTAVGNCSVSDTWFPKYLWAGPDAYLIRIYVYVDTAPVGSALEGNVECNSNNALDTEWSIAAAASSTDSGTTIDDTTYSNAQIEQDEFVEIDVSQCGSSTPGGNAAWAKLVFIIP